MTREQAEKMIAGKLIEISKIVENYYPQDGYLSLSINLEEGIMYFNNAFWEHAVGKLNKRLFREGGEWK